jgi:hypothetical protein
MFSGWYDDEQKASFIQIGRTVFMVTVEEFMDFYDMIGELQQDMLEDPELELGTSTDEDGNEYQEFVIKKKDEDYS